MFLAIESSASLWVLLGVAGLGFAAYTFWRSRLAPKAPGADTLRATVADVREGGAIRLGAFGDEHEDVVLPVASLATWRLGPDEWHEVTGDYRGRTLLVEWRRGPNGLKVVAFNKTGLAPAALGLDPAALDALKPGERIAVAGGSYALEHAGDAVRTSARDGSRLARVLSLVDEEKRQVLRVERTGEAAPVVATGTPVAADAIEVVRLS